jgi:hypothetical protein
LADATAADANSPGDMTTTPKATRKTFQKKARLERFVESRFAFRFFLRIHGGVSKKNFERAG